MAYRARSLPIGERLSDRGIDWEPLISLFIVLTASTGECFLSLRRRRQIEMGLAS